MLVATMLSRNSRRAVAVEITQVAAIHTIHRRLLDAAATTPNASTSTTMPQSNLI